MKRSTVFSLIAAACALFALIFSVNFLFVQRAASDVLSSDPRNYGIEVSAHYDYWIDTSNIVFDLTEVSGTSSEADVTRVLFRFAEKVKDRRFGRVYLAFQGHEKFFLDGEYFKELGDQVGSQNPVYLIRTLPENVRTLSGESAFGTWTGGILGVVGKQIEDFNRFHHDWYLNDMAASAH